MPVLTSRLIAKLIHAKALSRKAANKNRECRNIAGGKMPARRTTVRFRYIPSSLCKLLGAFAHSRLCVKPLPDSLPFAVLLHASASKRLKSSHTGVFPAESWGANIHATVSNDVKTVHVSLKPVSKVSFVRLRRGIVNPPLRTFLSPTPAALRRARASRQPAGESIGWHRGCARWSVRSFRNRP